jgi:hypothetical protein
MVEGSWAGGISIWVGRPSDMVAGTLTKADLDNSLLYRPGS